ncbi:DsbA family oxidoreductase [Flaviflexus equikiangi]|uniref:DsbA family oxidoreductase n=1 Tax=Flaviflexus equikiangi TaxID=2758573 RepID=A0ABS2TD47_9ACTO|nr:DsbA family oxidoreductase [Flaviflexus equikiangi]MBM9432258.1 DsbA family oxidoreductase [Flaviflexus equikiangi]
MSTTLSIDLWTDLVCPFCYIGESRLRRALERRGIAAEIRIRSFELDPDVREPMNVTDRLAQRKGLTRAQVVEMEGQVQAMAQAEGLDYVTDRLQGSTLPVHLIAQYANTVSAEAGEEFFRSAQTSYFNGSFNPFDESELIGFAVDSGLDRAGVTAALTDPDLLDAVRTDQQIARQLGVQGVPYILLDRKLAIPGALSLEQFESAIAQVEELGS